MDKGTGEMLTILCKEFTRLTAELRAMQEEIRLLKKAAQDEPAKNDQRSECKRVMFVPRSQL